MDDFMKEAVYGYSEGEKNIVTDVGAITYVDAEVQTGNGEDRKIISDMPSMWTEAGDYNIIKR